MKILRKVAVLILCLGLLGFGINYIFLTTHVSVDEIESIYVYHTENGARIKEYNISFVEKKLYSFESTDGGNRNGETNDGYQGVVSVSDEQLARFVSGANSCAFFNWKLRYVDESITDTSAYPQWGVEVKYKNSAMSKTVGIGAYPMRFEYMQKVFKQSFGLNIL